MRVTFSARPLGIIAVAMLAWPLAASADLSPGDLPADSSWYFHTDLDEMRSSDAGRDLHDWLDREVFAELREEIGIDLAKEADKVTAYSGGDGKVVFVLEGDIDSVSEDKLMALAASAEEFRTLSHRDKAYHFVRGEGRSPNGEIQVDSFDDGAYFSFALKNKLIATSTEEQMQELLDNKGRIAGNRGPSGSLFVLSAEKSLVQAGVDADEFAERGDSGWDSNFLSNARQVALLVADAGGKLAVEAQMIASDAEKAEALANIARGIVALQAFSDDMEPHVREVLQNTKIDVMDATLKLKLALDPAVLVATLDD